MKKLIYIGGVVVINMILFGSLFKLMHWPGAGILITVGFVLFSLWILPASLINNYIGNDRNKKWVYITIFIAVVIDFIGALFKIQHWPGASIFLLVGISIPFILFLPVYIYHHNKDKNAPSRNFLAVILLLIYIAVFSVFLALGVSKNILDNLVLTGNQVENSNQYFTIASFPEDIDAEKKSSVLNKANKIYSSIDEAKQALIDWDYEKYDEKPITEEFDVSMVLHKDDIYKSYHVMLYDGNGSSRSVVLKNELNDFRNECFHLIGEDEDKKRIIYQLLSTENINPDPQNKEWLVSWEDDNFRNVQLVSVFNNLSMIENNVRLATLITLDSEY